MNMFKKLVDFYLQQDEVEVLLRHCDVEEIIFFVLGPNGTHINMAANEWAKKINVFNKSVFHFVETLEIAVLKAKEVVDVHRLPIFVTCAVYDKLNKLFFGNPDCYFFLHHHYMRLDNIQLSARKKVDIIPPEWIIASHPSPKFLVTHLPNRIIETSSNSKAAILCAEGKVDCCITNETSKNLYNLETIFHFGKPILPFYFSTTLSGIKILKKIKALQKKS
ncbi:MAG: hypothetical protein AB1422_04240 [bacterium]